MSLTFIFNTIKASNFQVLIPKLLNNPSASYSFINFDFLLSHTTHFDDNTNLTFLHLCSLYFSNTFTNKSACVFYNTKMSNKKNKLSEPSDM